MFLRTSGGARIAGGRQLRYLRGLNDNFQRGNWDAALRSAIALGGASGALSLRMPKPRKSLELGGSGSSSGSPFYGPFVHQYLRDLYTQALTKLEAQDRIDEAAFLQAEILFDVRGAVSLLERSGKIETAARLAEARGLEPGLIVRLWWRAGDRERAITVARARGAFADAIARLTPVDPAAARSLRISWVHACTLAGDHHAAVDAAWPDPELRPLARPDLEAGLALDHTQAAWFLAHFVCGLPEETHVDASLRLLRSDDAERGPARDEFVRAFAGLEPTDPVADRRLAGAALLAQLRDGRPALSKKEGTRLTSALRDRADPVLVADLPPISARPTASGGVAELHLGAESGGQALEDAVVLADGRTLLALGESGLRLVSRSGRTAATWQRPTHKIVMADHGSSALIVSRAGRNAEIARLDLTTNRLTEWTALADTHIVDSYDGGLLTVVNANKILLLDVLSPTASAVWNELEAGQSVHAINRTPTSLTAQVHTRRAGERTLIELWNWELPSMTLRIRSRPHLNADHPSIALPGALLSLQSRPDNTGRLWFFKGWEDPAEGERDLATGSTIESSGMVYLVAGSDELGKRCTLAEAAKTVAHITSASQADLHVHDHRDVATVHRRDGHVKGINKSTGSIFAEHRTSW